MKAGHAAIAQGALAADGWLGYPDLLRRVETPSSFGSWSYEAYDTKLARETRGTTILQLSLLLGSPRAASRARRPTRSTSSRPLGDRRLTASPTSRPTTGSSKSRLKETAAGIPPRSPPPTTPSRSITATSAAGGTQCDKRRRNDDHLSLVAGISRLQRRELEAHGITTLERLGDLGSPLPFKPSRGSRESFERVQTGPRPARGAGEPAPVHELLQPVEEGRGLALLPEPSLGDVFLDLEGDHSPPRAAASTSSA